MKFDKICSFSSLLGLMFSVMAIVNTDWRLLLMTICLFIFAFILIFSFFKYKKAQNYLSGEDEIRNLHNEIVLSSSKVKYANLQAAIVDLLKFCGHISKAFGKIKNTQIGVCIKYVNGDVENLYVKTLCRDEHSRLERCSYDKKEDVDYLFANTDFLHIFEQAKKSKDFSELYFLGNYLPNKYQYTNSHLKIELPQGLLNYFKRRALWPLPYKSTIVVPFCAKEDRSVSAFLCIDSKNNNGFNKKDVKILQEIALFMHATIDAVCVKFLKNEINGQ